MPNLFLFLSLASMVAFQIIVNIYCPNGVVNTTGKMKENTTILGKILEVPLHRRRKMLSYSFLFVGFALFYQINSRNFCLFFAIPMPILLSVFPLENLLLLRSVWMVYLNNVTFNTDLTEYLIKLEQCFWTKKLNKRCCFFSPFFYFL